MKRQLNEIKRMQQLAGIITESTIEEDASYINMIKRRYTPEEISQFEKIASQAKNFQDADNKLRVAGCKNPDVFAGDFHNDSTGYQAESLTNETVFSSGDVNAILKKAQAAIEAGEEVTVDGVKIGKVVPAAGAFIPADGSKPYPRIRDYYGNMSAIKINGQPMELKPQEPSKPTTRTTGISNSDWSDRYGPNGGYETGAGRYTGD